MPRTAGGAAMQTAFRRAEGPALRTEAAAGGLLLSGAMCGAGLGLAAAFPQAWPAAWIALALHGLIVLTLARRSPLLALLALTLGWWAWQATGMGWVVMAVRDSEWAAWWRLGVLIFVLLVQGAPLLATWWLLGRSAARIGWADGGRATGWLALRWGLTLACTDSLRQFGWLGSGYAGLGLPFFDLPGADAWIPLVGATGWGWLVLLSAAGAALACWHGLAGQRRAGRRCAAITLAGSALVMLLPLPGARSEPAAAAPAEVALLAVQPPAQRGLQWTMKGRDDAIGQLQAAIADAPAGSVIVTAETFFPEPPPRDGAGRWGELLHSMQARGVHLLVGMPYLMRNHEGVHLINSIVQLSPQRQSLYAKERLVPGGEYLPWSDVLGGVYAQLFNNVRDGQRSGPPELTAPLFVANGSVGASICHELSFALTMAQRADGVGWLVNVADDAWIDSDLYRRQMLSIARLRALESGKPLLRVSQGGPTALIAPDGRVLDQTLNLDAATLHLRLQPRLGRSAYHQLAPSLAAAPLLLALALCVGGFLRGVPRRPTSETQLP